MILGFWAVLPVKPFPKGKSRLAGYITDAQRATLNRCLFEHMLKTLHAAPRLEQVMVISRDPQVLSLARRYGARTLLENRNSNLNRALEVATALVRERTQRGLLILPSDLPLLSVEDIESMLDLAARPPMVAIAPDRHGKGTNALLVSPPGLLRYAFGVNSFERHCQLARQAGAHLEVLQRHALSLDLDLPEDLDILQNSFGGRFECQDFFNHVKSAEPGIGL